MNIYIYESMELACMNIHIYECFHKYTYVYMCVFAKYIYMIDTHVQNIHVVNMYLLICQLLCGADILCSVRTCRTVLRTSLGIATAATDGPPGPAPTASSAHGAEGVMSIGNQ